MHDFLVKSSEIICHVLNVAPSVVTAVGEGVVVVGKAISTVLCGTPPTP